LRIAREHFDDVVVEAVVELALKGPGKLLVLDFARAQQENVSVDLDALGLEVDEDFDAVFGFARVEAEKRMLVAREFMLHFFDELFHGAACRK
jgi:hypothetical protein